MTPQQQESIFTICLMAGFADGSKDETEREEVRRIAETLGGSELPVRELTQAVLLRRVTLAQAAQPLNTPDMRNLAYEMAVCVCDADGAVNDAEKAFLAELRQTLHPQSLEADRVEQTAETLAIAPLAAVSNAAGSADPAASSAPANESEMESMILRYAMLNGALELLPNAIATMAIIPLQMKMVYRIGKAHGYELDRGHIRELLTTAGLGMTSQVLEGFGRKLLGGLLGKVGGKLGKGIGRQAASSMISFASTWAIGQVAKRYYGGGRTLSGMQLKELFSSFSEKAKGLHAKYAPQIEQQSRQINPGEILNMVRGA